MCKGKRGRARVYEVSFCEGMVLFLRSCPRYFYFLSVCVSVVIKGFGRK